MSTVLFLGPTLAAGRAHELLPGCEVRPPAAQGDVLRALRDGASLIGLVDGWFDQQPAVWHKEILYALERGVPVLGASSMGALRAAELHPFGMVGVGRIFELFRDGVLEDDDEVAVAHGPAECGYTPLSEAMVNLRDRVEAAVAAGILQESAAARVVERLKELPYPDRNVERALSLAGEDASADGALEGFLRAPHVPLKERDAETLLSVLAAGPPASALPAVRVERTVFFERLRLLVAAEARPTDPPAGRPEARELLGLLAANQAELLGIEPGEDDLAEAAAAFCAARGLRDEPALRDWLARRQIAPADLESALREDALLRRMEGLYGPELLLRGERRRRLGC